MDPDRRQARPRVERKKGAGIRAYTHDDHPVRQQALLGGSHFPLDNGLARTLTLADDSGRVTDTHGHEVLGEPVVSTGASNSGYRFAAEPPCLRSDYHPVRARRYGPATRWLKGMPRVTTGATRATLNSLLEGDYEHVLALDRAVVTRGARAPAVVGTGRVAWHNAAGGSKSAVFRPASLAGGSYGATQIQSRGSGAPQKGKLPGRGRGC